MFRDLPRVKPTLANLLLANINTARANTETQLLFGFDMLVLLCTLALVGGKSRSLTAK